MSGRVDKEMKLNDECDILENNLGEITKRIDLEMEILEKSQILKHGKMQKDSVRYNIDIEESNTRINALKIRKRFISAKINKILTEIIEINPQGYHDAVSYNAST